MRFEGRIVRSGKYWLAEVPLLDAMTQGRSRTEALTMICDWIETMVDREEFEAIIHRSSESTFEVGGNDPRALVALLLRRRRQASGASLADLARKLGARSRNAYARYERGEAVPTIEKLDELLRATTSAGDFVIREAAEDSYGK